MSKFNKMEKKEKYVCKIKTLSDICSSILFTTFVFGVFLLMFSYAENLSHVRERFYRDNQQLGGSYNDNFAVQNYTWECQNQKCVKLLTHNEQISLNTCNMLCSQPPIWPKPQSINITNKKVSVINKENIVFDLPGQGVVKIMLQNATDIFKKNLATLKSGNRSVPEGIKLNVNIIVRADNVTKLKLNTDESYKLLIREDIQDVFVYISAQNYFGARHGLETLSQLIWYDEVLDELKILHDVDIEDSPEFAYRGVMVDTARNYFPLHQLKNIVDGMSMSKLNVFHLHLTDAVSFPIILPRVKELAEYGAYGADMVYTPQDIKDLVQYARLRGVRVILEIDAPSHVNAGWNYAEDLLDEKYVICGEADVFNGHLNPDNPHVLTVLENIYRDLLELSEENEIFHVGSDEVNLTCWNNTAAAKNVGDLKAFWTNYLNQILNKLKSANNDEYPDNIIIWSSPLTDSTYLRNLSGNITVQFWLGSINHILLAGHSVIYSTVGHWYLDCGFGPWKSTMRSGVCDPYTAWPTFYRYRPWIEHGHKSQVLGGEVCLWAEQVEIDTLETRIWPRAAAFAERVWSDPDNFDSYDIFTRLVSFRERLLSRGIKAAAMWPRWCSQNPGKC